jgi:alkylhydroperoxidase family enzyme
MHSHDDALTAAVVGEPDSPVIDSDLAAMLDFAEKLTATPWLMAEADLDALRQAGLTEEQVLVVVLITCLFNFMDRLADGLGVRMPEKWIAAMQRKHSPSGRATGPLRP